MTIVVDEIITETDNVSFTSIVLVLVTIVVSSAIARVVLVADSVALLVPMIPKVTESPLKVHSYHVSLGCRLNHSAKIVISLPGASWM